MREGAIMICFYSISRLMPHSWIKSDVLLLQEQLQYREFATLCRVHIHSPYIPGGNATMLAFSSSSVCCTLWTANTSSLIINIFVPQQSNLLSFLFSVLNTFPDFSCLLSCLPAANWRPEFWTSTTALNNTCLESKSSFGSNYLLLVDLKCGSVPKQAVIVASTLYP